MSTPKNDAPETAAHDGGDVSIDPDGFFGLEASFGRGSSARKLLVSKPMTLKQIHLASKDD